MDPLPVELIDRRQSEVPRLAHPAVDHDRQTPSPFRHIVMGDRLGEELRRKVVDHVEAEILKYLGGRGAAGPRHAGHDQDFRSRLNVGRSRSVRLSSTPMERRVQLGGNPSGSTSSSSSREASRIRLSEPNLFSSTFFRVGPMPWHLVERRVDHALRAKVAVIGDGEAVGFVAHLLQQVQRFLIPGDADRFRLAREVHLLHPFGQPGDRDLQVELRQHL